MPVPEAAASPAWRGDALRVRFPTTAFREPVAHHHTKTSYTVV